MHFLHSNVHDHDNSFYPYNRYNHLVQTFNKVADFFLTYKRNKDY